VVKYRHEKTPVFHPRRPYSVIPCAFADCAHVVAERILKIMCVGKMANFQQNPPAGNANR